MNVKQRIGAYEENMYSLLYIHPPSQETPHLCGEECKHHLLRRDAYHAEAERRRIAIAASG